MREGEGALRILLRGEVTTLREGRRGKQREKGKRPRPHQKETCSGSQELIKEVHRIRKKMGKRIRYRKR
ncbi:hypothetical protein E2C01_050809 [Portunus trituberculatus]|uniref:Uncharacterized protein n=1 Tax=Portunus trituberculatus TaxID=210409 RepID=A0A5B7GJZ1_PORTR|nr:hypothetical protein [Portunus trituberculatus]